MDEELTEFAYSIATPEQWEESYQCGNFNTIKWANVEVVEEKTRGDMIRMMLKCFRLSPHASLQAFVSLTDIVYGFETGLEGDVYPSIVANPYNIDYSLLRSDFCYQLVTSYSTFINHSILRYLRTYGICLFLLLVLFVGRLSWREWDSWKKTFMLIPLLTYDFGTMLLLTGDDSRFFYITFLITPILIIYSLCKGEKRVV